MERAEREKLRFSLEDVPHFFAEIRTKAHRMGYIAAIYGSTPADGEGNDLDVALLHIAGRGHARAAFVESFGGTVEQVTARGGQIGYHVIRDGKLFHFMFGGF